MILETVHALSMDYEKIETADSMNSLNAVSQQSLRDFYGVCNNG